ncbi:MAG: family transcriptional regulator, regulator of sulfur utilization [Pseudonocardiales bacterium]|jgi:transcriptional regulator with XRE-family HTH domain|nr:family transcriptional regulator, regulator of sulfur utilization [Pseudonocardiales bacterium]
MRDDIRVDAAGANDLAGARDTAEPALPDGSGHVGPRVRALREERGLSLSALARRASVGKATLSGLEAGTRNPTLDTLHSVAAALGLPLTAIVSGVPGSTSPTGGRIRGAAVHMELLKVFDDGPVTYELFRMRIPAGAAQTSPAHHVGVTEHVTVFAGTLQFGPPNASREVTAGGYGEWSADVPHGYAAVGPEDVDASLVIRYPRTRACPAPEPDVADRRS